MANIDSLISESKLTHRELSNRVGNASNWFNDAYNNNEDIYLSSFTKVLSVIQEESNLDDYKLLDMYDNKILKIAQLIAKLSDEEDVQHIKGFIISEKSTFVDLLGDWASIEHNNKLSNSEIKTMSQLQNIIKNN